MEDQLEEYVIWALQNERNLELPIPGAVPPLLAAASAGLGNMTRTLLSFGINPNTKDVESGWTSLMLASELGFLSVVQELLAKSADINYKTEDTGMHESVLP